MNKELIKKYWKDPKGHSLMLLLLWLVFLTFLIGIVSIANYFSPKREIMSQEKTSMSYEDIWQNFLKKDFSYTYTISINEELIKFEGKVVENTNFGYRERKDGIVKYSIEDDKTYEILLEEKNEVFNLFENVNAYLLDLNYIYEFVSKIPIENTDIVDGQGKLLYKYYGELENDKIKITVVVSNTNITNILIEKLDDKYVLSFY